LYLRITILIFKPDSSRRDNGELKDSDNKWDLRYLTGIVDGRGEQLHYDGYAVNTEKTVENPLSDGGLFKYGYCFNGHDPCVNSIMAFINMDSCRLSTGDGCVPIESSVNTYQHKNEAKEGANNPGFVDKYDNNMFRFFDSARSSFFGGFGDQKGNAWAQITFAANDQLRQHIAWTFLTNPCCHTIPGKLEDIQWTECCVGSILISVSNNNSC
jgi:hypothetical protein